MQRTFIEAHCVSGIIRETFMTLKFHWPKCVDRELIVSYI